MCPKTGKQLLADLRQEGGGRDIPLGTTDLMTAAACAAERLAELKAGPLRGPQSVLPLGETYRLTHAFADVQRFGPRETSPEQKREWFRHARHWLDVLGDVDVNRTVWWDAVTRAVTHWQNQEPAERTGKKDDHGPRVARLTNDTINKRVSSLSVALRTAFNRHRLAELPRFPDRLSTENVPRDRWATPVELAALVAEIMRHTGPYTYEMRYGRVMRVMLRSWMGMATRDAAAAPISGFNIQTGIWSRQRRSKTRVIGRDLPMPRPMRVLIAEWIASPWVRARRAKDPVLYPWPNEGRGLEMYCRAIGIPPLVPHDYRRTAAHLIRLCGYDRPFCARWLMLAENSPMLSRVYLQDDPLARPDEGLVDNLMAALGAAVSPATAIVVAPARRLTALPERVTILEVNAEVSEVTHASPPRNLQRTTSEVPCE